MSSRHIIDIATRRSSGKRKSKTGSSRPAIEAATDQAAAAMGVVVSIGTPTRIGAALRAVRRDLPVAVLEAHLHDLRTCSEGDEFSVALVGQWLEERLRAATAVVTAKPTAAVGQGESQLGGTGGSGRRRKVPGKRRAAKLAKPCRGGDA